MINGTSTFCSLFLIALTNSQEWPYRNHLQFEAEILLNTLPNTPASPLFGNVSVSFRGQTHGISACRRVMGGQPHHAAGMCFLIL